jgi:hypothetical protein
LQASSICTLPREVVLHQLVAARLAIHALQHAGVGSGVDQPILRLQALQIGSLADVT